MDNSIYVALSKQTGAERQMDVIANNIANANTPGFKGQTALFSEYLRQDGKTKTSYANSAGNVRDDSQGSMQVTGNPLDLAIQGQGYFEVTSPSGQQLYTRAGNFSIDSQGNLINQDGYAVGDTGGQNIQFQPEDKQIKIYADGRIEVDGDERTTIGVFNIGSGSAIKEVSGGLFATSQGATNVDEPRVAQGMLENSNVQPISEMTKMIAVQRDFERTSNFINSMYDMQNNAIQTFSKAN